MATKIIATKEYPYRDVEIDCYQQLIKESMFNDRRIYLLWFTVGFDVFIASTDLFSDYDPHNWALWVTTAVNTAMFLYAGYDRYRIHNLKETEKLHLYKTIELDAKHVVFHARNFLYSWGLGALATTTMLIYKYASGD